MLAKLYYPKMCVCSTLGGLNGYVSGIFISSWYLPPAKDKNKLEIKPNEHYSSLVSHDTKAYTSKWADFQVIQIYPEVLVRRQI